MTTTTVTVCLPTADRAAAHAFYRDGFGFEPIGPPADDGLPEPLQFVVNDGLRLMFIPTGGFGWVTADHEVAPKGTSECLLSRTLATAADVDAAAVRAVEAGGSLASPAQQLPWGYEATIADPDGHLWGLTALPAV